LISTRNYVQSQHERNKIRKRMSECLRTTVKNSCRTKTLSFIIKHYYLPRSFLLNPYPLIVDVQLRKIFDFRKKQLKNESLEERAFHNYQKLFKSLLKALYDTEWPREGEMDHFRDNDNESLGWICKRWSRNRYRWSKCWIYFHCSYRRLR